MAERDIQPVVTSVRLVIGGVNEAGEQETENAAYERFLRMLYPQVHPWQKIRVLPPQRRKAARISRTRRIRNIINL